MVLAPGTVDPARGRTIFIAAMKESPSPHRLNRTELLLGQAVMARLQAARVILFGVGGVIGIVLGLSMAAVGAHILGMPYIPSPPIIAVAFIFSAAVGVVFGYFPARQAARLDPIEALRHE